MAGGAMFVTEPFLRPSGLADLLIFLGLAAWAVFLRRFAAGAWIPSRFCSPAAILFATTFL